MASTIRKAIIPVAGLGTRFLPATKAQPKEMLPIVDKPIIQYIVEEAVAAGITEIIFVTAIGKRAIEDHFDRNFELEYRLEESGKKEILKRVAKIGRLASFAFVRQHKPRGDGHAILAALPFVDQHEPVAILFGDDVLQSAQPGIGQLIETYEQYGGSVIAVTKVPKRETGKYGIVAGKRCAEHIYKVTEFVEKPEPEHAPSNLAWIARSVITPQVMALLRSVAPGKDGEIRLADAFVAALKVGEPIYAREVIGDRYDCGNPLGFLEANVAMGLAHPGLKKEFKRFLKKKTTS
ncbi:MAG: UTP--glucose-1-phosphate uridylyltransferase GalU [Candidatus Uhrbacteria bacterium]